MPDVYTTGSWRPFKGQEEAFVLAWKEFADWAAGLPGARGVRTLRATSATLSGS